MKYPSNEEVGERFRKIIDQEALRDASDMRIKGLTTGHFLDFISKTRLSDLDAIIEKVVETRVEAQKHPMRATRETEMKEYNEGYSNALEFVLSYLKSLKNQK